RATARTPLRPSLTVGTPAAAAGRVRRYPTDRDPLPDRARLARRGARLDPSQQHERAGQPRRAAELAPVRPASAAAAVERRLAPRGGPEPLSAVPLRPHPATGWRSRGRRAAAAS